MATRKPLPFKPLPTFSRKVFRPKKRPQVRVSSRTTTRRARARGA